MYDWNKDGKIDMVDHWITHQIVNYEKEKRENGSTYHSSSYNSIHYENSTNDNENRKKGPSTFAIIMIDILLFLLLCMMNSCGA